MHMPKSNTFAYLCCMLLGAVFIYLGATHLRLMRPRAVKTFCVLLIVGFLSLQMCWYGVNYLPSASKSVHSYNRNN